MYQSVCLCANLLWSDLERALALAQQAAARNDSLPVDRSLLSLIYAQKQQYDEALAEGERAIALDPNNADSYVFHAQVLSFVGRPEEARRMVERAMRLNPRYPPLYLFELGWAYRSIGRSTEAAATLKEVINRSPDFLPAHLHLAVSYVQQWAFQQSADAQTLPQALVAVQRVLALSGSSPWGHAAFGLVLSVAKAV